MWSIKNISKPFFHLITSSTKIIEFENVKFSKNISSKDGVSRDFLGTDSNGTSSKKWVLQKREFSYTFFHSINYNNLVDTKQISFLPTFLKPWFHMSDNVAGLVGGSQY